MPTVKKLTFDLEGNGEMTVVKISVNSKGEFSADLPLFLKSANQDTVSRCESLDQAEKKVYRLVHEYRKFKETIKRVILIEFQQNSIPHINSGIGMSFCYCVADKVTFGKRVEYRLVSKSMNGEYQSEYGQELPTMRQNYLDNGVVAGESIELDFTESNIRAITDLHDKLDTLCQKLKDLCSTDMMILTFIGLALPMPLTTEAN